MITMMIPLEMLTFHGKLMVITLEILVSNLHLISCFLFKCLLQIFYFVFHPHEIHHEYEKVKFNLISFIKIFLHLFLILLYFLLFTFHALFLFQFEIKFNGWNLFLSPLSFFLHEILKFIQIHISIQRELLYYIYHLFLVREQR